MEKKILGNNILEKIFEISIANYLYYKGDGNWFITDAIISSSFLDPGLFGPQPVFKFKRLTVNSHFTLRITSFVCTIHRVHGALKKLLIRR